MNIEFILWLLFLLFVIFVFIWAIRKTDRNARRTYLRRRDTRSDAERRGESPFVAHTQQVSAETPAGDKVKIIPTGKAPASIYGESTRSVDAKHTKHTDGHSLKAHSRDGEAEVVVPRKPSTKAKAKKIKSSDGIKSKSKSTKSHVIADSKKATNKQSTKKKKSDKQRSDSSASSGKQVAPVQKAGKSPSTSVSDISKKSDQTKSKSKSKQDPPTVVTDAKKNANEQDRDDLTQVHGVGDATSQLLNEHDVYTYRQLADVEQPKLMGWIEAGNDESAHLNAPETWSEQARYLADGETAKHAQFVEKIRAKSEPDDLTQLYGIGDETGQLLNEHDIYTYRQLADVEQPKLMGWIEAKNDEGAHLNAPETWSEQARYLADGETAKYAKFVGKIRAESEAKSDVVVETTPEPEQVEQKEDKDDGDDSSAAPDDLTKVYGIGKVINKLLNSKGVYTFRQLSRQDAAVLTTWLEEAEISQINPPDTWAEQAGYLADGDKTSFKQIVDRLREERKQQRKKSSK